VFVLWLLILFCLGFRRLAISKFCSLIAFGRARNGVCLKHGLFG
jgi:hypothetical protein